jgi:hypothetical protein
MSEEEKRRSAECDRNRMSLCGELFKSIEQKSREIEEQQRRNEKWKSNKEGTRNVRIRKKSRQMEG